MVLARVVEPTSKRDVPRVVEQLGQKPVSLSTLMRHLRQANSQNYRDQLATHCFHYALTSGDLSLTLYDVTTLHWETDTEDSLRKVGFSKERRVDPQIIVGLLTDRVGFRLEIGCWEGNKGRKAHGRDDGQAVS